MLYKWLRGVPARARLTQALFPKLMSLFLLTIIRMDVQTFHKKYTLKNKTNNKQKNVP